MKTTDKLSGEIDDLWHKHLPVVRSRIETIQLAVEAIRSNRLTPDLRADAKQSAHNLAGSLGTFGLERGSEAASEIEKLLSKGSSDFVPAEELSRYLDKVKSQVNSK